MKPFAVESRVRYFRNNLEASESDSWVVQNKYKSIKSMLQGLFDLRNNENTSYWKTPSDGKIVVWKFIWQYRPVHSSQIVEA